MPSVEQDAGTLPCSFKEKLPTTFAIIDGSEILQKRQQTYTCSCQRGANASTPTQPSFWLLVLLMVLFAVSQLCWLHIRVELTRICRFLTKLEDKPGISIMADRGFTVKGYASEVGHWTEYTPIRRGQAAASS